jgi:phosphatidylserine synthase
MRQHLKTIPNQITAARLVLLAVMWALVLLRLPFYIGVSMIVSFVGDYLDGYFARRLGQSSDFGSQFDSLVDNLLTPSTLVWLWLLRPEVYRENSWLWLLGIGVYFGSIFVGLLKFRRFGNLHLKSRRYASVPMYLFVAHTFMADHYSPLLLYLALGASIVSSGEGLLIQLLCSRVDAHMGSLLNVLKNRARYLA